MKPFLRCSALCALLLSSACAATPDIAAPTSVTEQFSQPYFVNVAAIQIDTPYDALANAKDVAGTFPTPPALALKRYAETRLKAAGGHGRLRFVIEDASVFREDLESSNDLARRIGADNRDRYTAKISLGLHRDTEGFQTPGAVGTRLKAERTLTIPDNVSLDERDRHLQAFTAQLLMDIDRSVTAALTDTLLLSTVEPAPSPGSFPVEPVDILPQP